MARILLADDEPQLLSLMSLYLHRLGYQVATATDAATARAQFHAEPDGFAVVVLDATLPGSSAQELAAGMLEGRPRLCVIAASGFPTDVTELLATAPGRVMFLHKPFSPAMLADAIRRLLATQEESV